MFVISTINEVGAHVACRARAVACVEPKMKMASIHRWIEAISIGISSGYSFFQLGLRFSAKARGPSIRSFDWKSFLVAGKLVLLASSSGMCKPA